MSQVSRKRRGGFTLIELLIAIVIIATLAAIAIPNLMNANRKAKYSRAAADTKTAASQSIAYAIDKQVLPTSLDVLRTAGYASVADFDPWKIPYQLSPSLQAGNQITGSEDIYIFSKGAIATGAYPVPFVSDTGVNGSVGYSSVYGSWTGS